MGQEGRARSGRSRRRRWTRGESEPRAFEGRWEDLLLFSIHPTRHQGRPMSAHFLLTETEVPKQTATFPLLNGGPPSHCCHTHKQVAQAVRKNPSESLQGPVATAKGQLRVFHLRGTPWVESQGPRHSKTPRLVGLCYFAFCCCSWLFSDMIGIVKFWRVPSVASGLFS